MHGRPQLSSDPLASQPSHHYPSENTPIQLALGMSHTTLPFIMYHTHTHTHFTHANPQKHIIRRLRLSPVCSPGRPEERLPTLPPSAPQKSILLGSPVPTDRTPACSARPGNMKRPDPGCQLVIPSASQ